MSRSLTQRAHAPHRAALPGEHLGLRWRGLRHTDTDALHNMLQRCETVDETARTSRHQVANTLAPTEGTLADGLGGFDSGGTLRAGATVHTRAPDDVYVRAIIHGSVDPTWRGRGIGRALLSWQEDRARQMLAHTGGDLPARIAAYVAEHLTDRRRLYAAAGFSPKRYYHQMRRDLERDVPSPGPTAGIELQPWTTAIDEQVRQAHNEAFRDHWGSQPIGPAIWARRHDELLPSWSRVAVDASRGEVAGYALVSRPEAEWQAGRREGHIDVLGVRRAYRGLGLARSLLAAIMQAVAADHVGAISLEVDSDNPTGANGLYRRMGFEPSGGEVLYTIEL